MESSTAAPPAPADLEEKRREAEAAQAEQNGNGGETAEPETGEQPGEGQGEGAEGGEQAAPEGDGEGSSAEGDGEQPGEGDGEQAAPELAITGASSLNLQPGGQKPDKSTVKLRGGSIAVAGKTQLKKGEVVNLLVKVRVDEVNFVDKHDNGTGEIIQTERRHIAKMIGVEKVE